MWLLCLLYCTNPDQGSNDIIQHGETLWTAAERQLLLDGLQRTMLEMLDLVTNLKEDQWNFTEGSGRWSIGNIVEHLELQDKMHYREVYLISKIPIMPEYVEVVKGNDHHFLAYATDPKPGRTSWNLEPNGRFCNQENTIRAFQRVREELIKYVQETEEDFRQHFTFRNYKPDGGLTNPGAWDVRDLHQLLLTTIAHTDRHLGQIKKIMQVASYPGD